MKSRDQAGVCARNAGPSEPLPLRCCAGDSRLPEKSLLWETSDEARYAGPRRYRKATLIQGSLTKNMRMTSRNGRVRTSNAGVLYICNPKQSDGTITSREDIEFDDGLTNDKDRFSG